MNHTGEVRGWPMFKLYRQFVEGLEYEFSRVEADATHKKKLVSRMELIERAMPEEFANVSTYLSACYLRARRKGGESALKIIKTLEACGIDGKPENCLKYSMAVAPDADTNILQAIYRNAKKDRESGEEERYRQEMLYLALHGHDDACRELAHLFAWLEPDDDLWGFWELRKEESSENPERECVF